MIQYVCLILHSLYAQIFADSNLCYPLMNINSELFTGFIINLGLHTVITQHGKTSNCIKLNLNYHLRLRITSIQCLSSSVVLGALELQIKIYIKSAQFHFKEHICILQRTQLSLHNSGRALNLCSGCKGSHVVQTTSQTSEMQCVLNTGVSLVQLAGLLSEIQQIVSCET